MTQEIDRNEIMMEVLEALRDALDQKLSTQLDERRGMQDEPTPPGASSMPAGGAPADEPEGLDADPMDDGFPAEEPPGGQMPPAPEEEEPSRPGWRPWMQRPPGSGRR